MCLAFVWITEHAAPVHDGYRPQCISNSHISTTTCTDGTSLEQQSLIRRCKTVIFHHKIAYEWQYFYFIYLLFLSHYGIFFVCFSNHLFYVVWRTITKPTLTPYDGRRHFGLSGNRTYDHPHASPEQITVLTTPTVF